MNNTLLFTLFFFSILALQLFLVKSKKMWIGFFLPFLFFVLSVIVALNAISLKSSVAVFIFYNIPTLILLLSYFFVLKKDSHSNIEKMKINDL